MKARGFVAIVLLLGFYAWTLAVAASLFALAIGGAFVLTGQLRIIVPALFGIPAILLVSGILSARPPAFRAPGQRLQRADAPGLFAAIDELAAAVGTAAPTEVYLTPFADLAVTEIGGVFGGHRVMILGTPVVELLTIHELRAGIAHELGHFAGGDTRLLGIVSFTEATFGAVALGGERDPFRSPTTSVGLEGGLALAEAVARGVVRSYGKLYWWVMHSFNRRQEVLADAISAKVAGSEVAARALEKASITMTLYSHYVESDVAFAFTKGALPTDLWAGFLDFRAQVLGTDDGRRFLETLQTQKTNRYDTHPALGDRLRAFASTAYPGLPGPDAPARTLFAGGLDLEPWTCQATCERLRAAVKVSDQTATAIQPMQWSEVGERVYLPTAREAARNVAEALYPLFPGAGTLSAMFASVVSAIAGGHGAPIVDRLNPGIAGLHPYDARELAGNVLARALGCLFQGALIERGATVGSSFGAPCLVFRLGEERIPAAVLAELALARGAWGPLSSWAARLAAPPSTGESAHPVSFA
jgi:Zn-dependent protease with chaperone function